MKGEFKVEEPNDIGSFAFDPNEYPDLDRMLFQKVLKRVYDQICLPSTQTIQEIEEAVKSEEYDDKYIKNALEFFNLPSEEVAYVQCLMDASELVDEEIRVVKDAGGEVDYEAIFNHAVTSGNTIYSIFLNCRAFKNDQDREGIRKFQYDFSTRIDKEMRKKYSP